MFDEKMPNEIMPDEKKPDEKTFFENLFDEKSEQWIRIYRGITIATFWIFVVGGVILAIDNWFISEIVEIIIADGYFLGGILLLLCGVGAGFIQLVANMLIIQLLNNIQIIRGRIENQ